MGTDAKPEISVEATNLICALVEKAKDATALVEDRVPALISESVARNALEFHIAALERKQALIDSNNDGFYFGSLFGRVSGPHVGYGFKFEKVTEAVCGIAICPSYTGFEALVDKLMEMVGEDNVFRWKGKPDV